MKPYLFTLVIALFSIFTSVAQADLMSYEGKATCKTMALVTTSIVPAGSYLIACTDGTSGLVWNDINNKQIFPLVSYCPLSFNDNGIKTALSFTDFYVVINDVSYSITGNTTDNHLSLLPLLPGTYNDLHGNACSFSVDDEGNVTVIKIN
jgi:hypothetical protein